MSLKSVPYKSYFPLEFCVLTWKLLGSELNGVVSDQCSSRIVSLDVFVEVTLAAYLPHVAWTGTGTEVVV